MENAQTLPDAIGEHDEEQAQKAHGIRRWASAVEAAGTKRGWSRAQTAEWLGVTIGYFNVLLSGGSKTQKQLGKELLCRSAELQGMSVVGVMLQAGLLQMSDLYATTDHEADLAAAYSRMNEVPELCAHLPTPDEWNGKAALSLHSKYGIAILFEIASERLFLQKRSLIQLEDDPG